MEAMLGLMSPPKLKLLLAWPSPLEATGCLPATGAECP